MRILEHRRHGLREPGTPHLSSAGVRQAERLAGEIGPFDRVITSPHARARETAVALGLAVDEVREELAAFPEEIPSGGGAEPTTFEAWARVLRDSSPLGEYARFQANVLRAVAEALPDGDRALLISHSGVIELGALGAALSQARRLGPLLAPLEGVRLDWDGHGWARIEALRVGRGPDQPITRRSRTATSSGVPEASTARSRPRSR